MVQETQEHIIQTQVFEVAFHEREGVTGLQDRISALFNNRLSDRMAAIFDRHLPADLLLKLERLELDLGSLPYEHFENELEERFAAELEKGLLDRLTLLKDQPNGALPGMQLTGSKAGLSEQLEHFLLHGSLPWWAGKAASPGHEALLNQLLAHNPAALKQMLIRVGQHEPARRRLVYSFSGEAMRSMIALLEPAESVFIFEYHQQISKTQQEKQVVSAESAAFEKEVMVFIVSTLLEDRGSQFNKKMFVKSTIRQMAAHYNVAYEQLLFLFSSFSEKAEPITKTDYFPVLLRELFSEHQQDQAAALPVLKPVSEQAPHIYSQTETLRHYLLFGSLPPWSEPLELKSLRRHFSELMNSSPRLARELLQLAAEHDKARQHFMNIADAPLFAQAVQLSEAGEAGFILDYTRILADFSARLSRPASTSSHTEALAQASVLAFLFSARSPVFDKRAFIETTVRQTAAFYRHTYGNALSFLAQFIGESYRSQQEHTSLFYLVAGMLKESRENKISTESATGKSLSHHDPGGSPEQAITVRDALLYLLQQGYFPWWAQHHAAAAPEALLNRLVKQSPENRQWLLSVAGTDAQAQQRALHLFSADALLEQFKELNGGAEALALFEALQTITGNRKESERTLLLTLWNTYKAGNYTQFTAAAYVENAIRQLALSSGQPLKELLKDLNRSAQPRSLPPVLLPVLNRLAAGSNRRVEEHYSDPAIFTITELVKAGLPAGAPADKTSLLQVSLEILNYFLNNNAMPASLGMLTGWQTQAVLKQLLTWLNSQQPDAVKQLLQNQALSPTVAWQLQHALALEGSSNARSLQAILSAQAQEELFSRSGSRATERLSQEQLNHWLANILQQPSGADKKERLLLFLRMDAAKHLATWQLGQEQFYQLLNEAGNMLPAEETARLKQLQDLLHASFTDTLEREKTTTLFKEFVLHYYTGHYPAMDFGAFLTGFFRFLSSRRGPGLLSTIAPVLQERMNTLPPASPLATAMVQLQNELQRHITDEEIRRQLNLELKQQDELATGELTGMDLAAKRAEEPGRIRQELLQQQADQKQAPGQPEATMEKLYIQNAGLVLLHPFIGTLFRLAGLTDNNRFVSEDSRHRGVHLLQHLVWGPHRHDEHHLTLNKLLCGMPLQQPLSPDFEISEQETATAQELLQQVTRQWDKLKNTSVEGFQASFLQRDAVLTRHEEHWNLKVELRGYDVLLQTLPWSYGMIKTPWMDQLMQVEWM